MLKYMHDCESPPAPTIGGVDRKPDSQVQADIRPQRLALRPAEAAAALGIGRRLLWSMTARGEIPHMRLGRRILYPVALLDAWMAGQAVGGPGHKK